MLRASRVGLLSTRYEITCDDTPVCTWKPSAFFGGGSFVLDGRRYEVTRGGWTGRRYRLLDDAGGLVVDGAPTGTARRTSAWWGEAEADLPGLPLPVQVFVLVSLLGVWDED